MSENKTSSQIEVKDMSFTANKPYISICFKKTQKIFQALYLVTRHLDRSELLQEAIRKSANDLANEATILLKSSHKDNDFFSEKLIVSFFNIQGLIETALMLSLISEKNYTIINDEIEKVIKTLNENSAKASLISAAFFNAGEVEDYIKKDIEDLGGNQGSTPIKDIPRVSMSYKTNPVLNTPKAQVNNDYSEKRENKTKRIDFIMSLFKPGIELMIKDITVHLKDVSEKTIQRELLLLVSLGKLKKIGERRWSKYRLKQ